MPGDSPNQLWVDSRTALLDVLDALGENAGRVVLVGAQAIYLRCDQTSLAIAPFTKDADIALIPPLGTEPALEAAMRAAGLELRAGQHGIWVREGAEVDLLVPDALAPAEGKRGARLEGHDPRAARKVVGLEGAAVDSDPMRITGLAPGDDRTAVIRVAGPAALLVAKVHKVAEKESSAALNKDAHDIYRLLVATDTDEVARRVRRLLDHPLTGEITAKALDDLQRLFGDPTSAGSVMAGAAEAGVGNPANVMASVSALADDLLRAVA
jgi:hypothetical protein